MFVTFGILTSNKADNVNMIIDSIEACNIPADRYEIVVIGNVALHRANTRVLFCEEDETKNWITRKKNAVVDESTAKDDDLVIIAKDYIMYDKGWYDGLVHFSNTTNFDIVMNPIANAKNQRYIDWVWNNPAVGAGRNIPYTVSDHHLMFVPGCFVAAKRRVFNTHRFKEELVGLGKQSDVEWSTRVLKSFKYVLNPHSKCIAFGKPSNRYPKFRRICECPRCATEKS